MDDLMQKLYGSPTHVVEWRNVDGTGDVQRFDDAEAMAARYQELTTGDPTTIFVVAIATSPDQGRPLARFRRDMTPSLSMLSKARRDRARYLCAAAQTRHEKRHGELAIRKCSMQDAFVRVD